MKRESAHEAFSSELGVHTIAGDEELGGVEVVSIPTCLEVVSCAQYFNSTRAREYRHEKCTNRAVKKGFLLRMVIV
jgi:hypothetical protein